MKKLLFVLIATLYASMAAQAQDESLFISKAREHDKQISEAKLTPWFITAQPCYTLAFGDDSWHVFKDFKKAHGSGFSLSVGRELSPLFSARLKGRYLELNNRINLEVYEAYKDKYPEFLPDEGFYGYRYWAAQAELMFDFVNLFRHSPKWFDAYIILGAGVNGTFWYDDNVQNWDGSYDGLFYPVDDRYHVMPAGILGGQLEFRLCKELGFNIEALATFTGDKLEGVKYEEPYDVVITLGVGLTLHL